MIGVCFVRKNMQYLVAYLVQYLLLSFLALIMMGWTELFLFYFTVKPVLSGHSQRRPKIGFQGRLSLNAGQKYCRILCNTFDLH